MFRFLLLIVLLLCTMLLACGGGVMNIRVLQQITVTPAKVTATADGTVKFTAKGTFNQAPMTVNPLQVVWTAGRIDFSQAPITPIASVDANGVAKCLPGASGTTQIFANAARDPSQPYAINNFTSGAAQLTCP